MIYVHLVGGLGNQLFQYAAAKNLAIKNIPVTYQGVRGRRSDNTLIKQELNWAPSQPLNKGLEKTYSWIKLQVKAGVSV